jgi:sulfite reductase alpha subunit
MSKSETPLLDELEKGRWPSFVKDIKQAAAKKAMAKDLLRQLELSYKEKIGHWKHGGIVGVKGYGGGVIGRYSDRPDLFPGVEHFHTMRINHPTGWFYTTEALRKICDIWDKRGSGLTNMHGSTGDIILLGTTTDQLQPTFDDLSDAGFDLGGSGSALRTPSACVGPARCEWACIDSLDICYNLTMHFQDQVHRPMFPYKFKIKVSACANDCVAAIARADFSIIGTWKGKIQIDQKEVQAYVASGLDVKAEVTDLCPTKCMAWDEGKKILKIEDADCTRCMHCINMMPKALRQGKEKGASILVGGKAPILQGAQLSSLIIPFVKLEPPYQELKDLISKVMDWWDENGKMRERLGELINRLGMRTFLRAVGLPPIPQMVRAPRTNPYVFFWPEDLKKEEK